MAHGTYRKHQLGCGARAVGSPRTPTTRWEETTREQGKGGGGEGGKVLHMRFGGLASAHGAKEEGDRR